MNLHDMALARFGQPLDAGDETAVNEGVARILDRRSCRRFLSRPVGEERMQVLLAAAVSAPSKSDLQQASVIRIADRQKQRRIANLSADTAWIADAPELLVWCGDNRRIRRVSAWRNHEFANDHLDAFFNAAVDAGIAMQTFILAAEAEGLGCCPVSQIRDNIDALSAELELPEWVFPVAGLCVGWPASQAAVSMRLPLAVTVHTDRYDDENLIDEVSHYDRRREAVDDTPDANQRMVDRFGVSADYGWSENRSRQYAIPARQDFGRYIRRQGFNLD